MSYLFGFWSLFWLQMCVLFIVRNPLHSSVYTLCCIKNHPYVLTHMFENSAYEYSYMYHTRSA